MFRGIIVILIAEKHSIEYFFQFKHSKRLTQISDYMATMGRKVCENGHCWVRRFYNEDLQSVLGETPINQAENALHKTELMYLLIIMVVACIYKAYYCLKSACFKEDDEKIAKRKFGKTRGFNCTGIIIRV